MTQPEHDEQEMTIDTSGMSEGKRNALELAESSRDQLVTRDSFAGSLFMGDYRWDRMFPYPNQAEEDRAQGDAFLEQLGTFLKDRVDPDRIDEEGEIPDEVIEELGRMGAFAIKISKEYGGLGLSQVNYSRAAILLGSYCGNLTALISAHQSIGVPQPLILFGTEEQKKKFLPRFAKGEISAFALTEPGVGSDPARMETCAEPSEDGEHFTINGEKLWCTNGTKASTIVVMARTPDREVKGKMRTNQITAFILDMDTPGVEVVMRCHFMGLKALYNGVLRFKDVKVPRENIVLGEGRGLKVALATLNTGRLTLPAACIGLAKQCLRVTRKWAGERVQWGAPIGHHAAIADKIAKMAANGFATEAITLYTSAQVDRKEGDIRLEAAMCKMWGTEAAWRITDETLQIRGGRGYETQASQEARGEDPAVPIERWLRDCRINTLFEGSSEIMRLFIAREALDVHLKVGGAVMNPKLSGGEKFKAALKAAGFYARWYPKMWMPTFVSPGLKDGRLNRQVRWAARCSRKLGRTLFHQMAKYGPKLEREGMVLGHLVDIGTELFTMSAVCAYADHLSGKDTEHGDAVVLADYFCREARLRIAESFRAIGKNTNREGYQLARLVLEGDFAWQEEGIVEE